MTAHEVRALLLQVTAAADSSRVEVVECKDPGFYLLHLSMGGNWTISFVMQGPMTSGGVALEEEKESS